MFLQIWVLNDAAGCAGCLALPGCVAKFWALPHKYAPVLEHHSTLLWNHRIHTISRRRLLPSILFSEMPSLAYGTRGEVIQNPSWAAGSLVFTCFLPACPRGTACWLSAICLPSCWQAFIPKHEAASASLLLYTRHPSPPFHEDIYGLCSLSSYHDISLTSSSCSSLPIQHRSPRRCPLRIVD
ncbi:hypothetical protein BD626DRAFT_504237 [Schizophyllum amplum]|uniref:Uncharacterized protein n=1 Tax=Schizophyllum amplum TaxID=97359 RepID=A0A550C6T9_9AGAR|nr:hypothetical protein BD626DRAFT_504237 [Auriculariopsis ampla]